MPERQGQGGEVPQGEQQESSADFITSEIARYTSGPEGVVEESDGDRSIPPDPRARLEELIGGISSSAGQFDLGSALLDRHLASLREDFEPLMGEEEMNAPYDRVESIVALFYSTLTDSYIGIDSHKPSEFWDVHPFLLDHLESSIKRSPLSTACHGRRVVRVLRKTFAELTKDQKRNSSGFRKYMRWHADNGVQLLRVDPGVVMRKQKQYHPTIWTTDIGLWPRTCALLFEPRISQADRMKLQLYLRYDANRFAEATAYVKDVLEGAEELLLDGRGRLRQRALTESDREDLNWSLEAIFEPGLATEWHEFVDSDARMGNREGRVILDHLDRESGSRKIAKEELRVFDAAMGVGSESVFLLKEGFQVISNEIDWTLISHARRHAEAKGVSLEFDRHDWRHFEQKLPQASQDVVLCLGNSLTCLLNPKEMVKALKGMHSILKPGGLLIIDERNYRDMLKREKEMLGDEFLFPGSFVYCGQEIKATPIEIMGASDVAILGYYDGTRLVGTFSVYCYDHGEFESLLNEAGLTVEQTYWDFDSKEEERAEFVTYAARRDGA